MRRTLMAVPIALLVMLGSAGFAAAAPYGSRTLAQGSSGDDVKEVQIRVASWYDNCAGVPCNTHFPLDGSFGPRTDRAVRNFQAAHGVPVTGRVDSRTYGALNSYEQPDGSTPHFDWSEFHEKSASCRTGNAGSFRGGYYSEWQTQQFVRYLMHRLEGIRGKLDHKHPINIHSGFRSIEYQRCLQGKTSGAASRSQHSYGMAADATMSGVHTGFMRAVSKTSQVHGLFCYSGDLHNHIDIRFDNPGGPNAFTWPSTDGAGRDLDHAGKVCRGGYGSPPSTGNKPPAVGGALNPIQPGLNATVGPEDEFRKQTSEEVWLAQDSE